MENSKISIPFPHSNANVYMCMFHILYTWKFMPTMHSPLRPLSPPHLFNSLNPKSTKLKPTFFSFLLQIMSQQQPQRPSEPIKYGDVFKVSGELASEPVAPQDAAILQAAEAVALGNTPMGAAAALVQSAADLNEQRGVVGHGDMTAVVRDRGVTISEAEVGGYRMVTESIGGQVIILALCFISIR